MIIYVSFNSLAIENPLLTSPNFIEVLAIPAKH